MEEIDFKDERERGRRDPISKISKKDYRCSKRRDGQPDIYPLERGHRTALPIIIEIT